MVVSAWEELFTAALEVGRAGKSEVLHSNTHDNDLDDGLA